MLLGIFSLVLNAVIGFFTLLLLVRVVMRFRRMSFISPLGQFVLATTNWVVLPFQRILPGRGRVDWSALLPAWLLQVAGVLLLALLGGHLGVGLLPAAALAGVFELVRSALYLLMGAVFLSVILSWVNPHSPLAGPVGQLTRPFLEPFRRLLPPIAGVDLSPLLLLLVLQIVLYVLQASQAQVFALLLR